MSGRQGSQEDGPPLRLALTFQSFRRRCVRNLLGREVGSHVSPAAPPRTFRPVIRERQFVHEKIILANQKDVLYMGTISPNFNT